MAVVTDTNVPIIASRSVDEESGNQQVNVECTKACIQQIQAIRDGTIVCLDDGWLILGEYRTQLTRLTIQSVGGQFLRWLLQRRADPRYCELVKITPRGTDGYDFEEFPDSLDLQAFDKSDRKFVAVALASKLDPTIVYAADRGWPRHRDALAANGVRIKALCEVTDK